MTMQTREQINACDRKRYSQPETKAKKRERNRLRYQRKHIGAAQCTPDYGLIFNSKAVQTTLTMWGG